MISSIQFNTNETLSIASNSNNSIQTSSKTSYTTNNYSTPPTPLTGNPDVCVTPWDDNIYYGWQTTKATYILSDKSISSSQSSSSGDTGSLGRCQGGQEQREREQHQQVDAKHSAAKPSSLLTDATDVSIGGRRGGLITRLR